MANITKRGNTFRIRVFVGYDMNGKQLVKSTTYTPPDGVTPKKAEKLAQEYAFEFERHCKGYSQLNENMRFSELADWYFTNYAPQELKESTIYTYKGQYKNHIEPVLGNVKVKDINAPRLTQIMQSYDLNPATVKKLYVIVQSIFRRGAEQGFIRDTPCRNVILPKRKKSRKNKALEEDKLKGSWNTSKASRGTKTSSVSSRFCCTQVCVRESALVLRGRTSTSRTKLSR